MSRNVLFIVAGIAVVALVAFAVWHSREKPVPVDEQLIPAAPPGPGQPDVPFIEQTDAKAIADAKIATVLDVRDVDAYAASHIPGALQIPLSRVEGEIPYFPKDKLIIAYCTCPHDEAAIEAVQILLHGGVRDARVLRGGLQEWKSLGYPTTSGLKN